MDIHVPSSSAVKGLASLVGYITDGLDAVVVEHSRSEVHEGFIYLKLAGNSRDLATAVDRARRVGGVVD